MSWIWRLLVIVVALTVPASALDPVINTTVLTPKDFTSYHLVTWSVDFGDVPDEPLMHPQYEWDEEIGGKGTILVDPLDGMYKAWYISQPGIDYLTYNSSEGAARMISYAVSHDGVNWDRPKLPIVKWDGNDTNLLLRLPDNHEVSYACVFVNVGAANRSETYEMLALLSTSPPGFKESHKQVIYRYYSPDGIHWTPSDEISHGPCAGGKWCSDSMYINKRADGSYQALLKHGSPSGAPPGGFVPFDIGAGHSRWIFVANSSDGEHWSSATLALAPDWRDGPGFQVISSISTIQASNALIGWLPVFHSLSQTIDMQFCASIDGGQTWWRPERRSAVPLKELGYYGGGMMWPYRLFVPDRDDPTKLHAYFSGCQGRHSDIHSTLPGERFHQMREEWASNGAWGYTNIKMSSGEYYSPIKSTNWFRGALMRATWDATRLWALIPAAGGDIPGQAITKPLTGVKGTSLKVNTKVHNQTRTKEMGSVSVEVLDTGTGEVVPGFALTDCHPVREDTKEGAITWTGGPTLPLDDVRLRFVLLRARLYSYELS